MCEFLHLCGAKNLGNRQKSTALPAQGPRAFQSPQEFLLDANLPARGLEWRWTFHRRSFAPGESLANAT